MSENLQELLQELLEKDPCCVCFGKSELIIENGSNSGWRSPYDYFCGNCYDKLISDFKPFNQTQLDKGE